MTGTPAHVDPAVCDEHASTLAVVAHELLNSITVMCGLLDTTVSSWDALGDDERLHLLHRVRSHADRQRDALADVAHLFAVDTEQVIDKLRAETGAY